MKSCYEILGVKEDATLDQIQEAFEQKASRYKGEFYEDDPAYVKRKLKELQEAYSEAASMIAGELSESVMEKPTVSYDEEPEEYMRQLYHKHLTAKVNRAAGLRPKRAKAFAKGEAAYKRSIIFFWGGIVAAVIVIGSLL